MEIISVINCKGGVGKTTIIAVGGRLRSEAINTLNLGSGAPESQTDA
jgi:hypothetical protein